MVPAFLIKWNSGERMCIKGLVTIYINFPFIGLLIAVK